MEPNQGQGAIYAQMPDSSLQQAGKQPQQPRQQPQQPKPQRQSQQQPPKQGGNYAEMPDVTQADLDNHGYWDMSDGASSENYDQSQNTNHYAKLPQHNSSQYATLPSESQGAQNPHNPNQYAFVPESYSDYIDTDKYSHQNPDDHYAALSGVPSQTTTADPPISPRKSTAHTDYGSILGALSQKPQEPVPSQQQSPYAPLRPGEKTPPAATPSQVKQEVCVACLLVQFFFFFFVV